MVVILLVAAFYFLDGLGAAYRLMKRAILFGVGFRYVSSFLCYQNEIDVCSQNLARYIFTLIYNLGVDLRTSNRRLTEQIRDRLDRDLCIMPPCCWIVKLHMVWPT